jgi:MarR family transcriptional repressor of mepA
VSGLLARLEKKGFIEMRSDREDRRCKRIYLLDKGKDCNKSMYETICATENRLVEGFTEEEKEQFFGYLNRAIANMGCSSCNPKHKEETQA